MGESQKTNKPRQVLSARNTALIERCLFLRVDRNDDNRHG